MRYAVLILALVLAGCASKRTVTHYHLDPANCINWVDLYCSANGPPDCKKVTVDYKKGCEKLVAK